MVEPPEHLRPAPAGTTPGPSSTTPPPGASPEACPTPHAPRGAARSALAAMLALGTVSFGGGSALIPLAEDQMVRRRGLLTPAAFTRHTVVASITPGALPAKLGSLAGADLSGGRLALVLGLAVALPGTLMTLGLVATVSSGPALTVAVVEAASVGITAFVLALLMHYVVAVVRDGSPSPWTALTLTLLTWLATGLPTAAALLTSTTGIRTASSLPSLGAVHVVVLALALVMGRAALRARWNRGAARAPAAGTTTEPEMPRERAWPTAALLLAPAVLALVVATATLGRRAAELLGLVALSTVTSFGGGPAYVGVADGFFVGGGHVDPTTFYNQLVPISNAMPGPVLVKLAAAVGFSAAPPGSGAAGAWLLGTSAALVALGISTAVAALVMAGYRRAARSPVVQDVGRYLLPVIGGLLITTSSSMLLGATTLAEGVGVPPWLTVLCLTTAVLLLVAVRRRRRVPDVVLLLLCGAGSTAALLAAR